MPGKKTFPGKIIWSNAVTSSTKTRTLLMKGVELLSRREHSRDELKYKLMRSLSEDQTSEDVSSCLNVLEAKGYLSDTRFAEARVRTRASRYGNQRLIQELRMKGVDSVAIEQALQEAGDELQRARSIWSKKFGRPPIDHKERNRQIRFLASRGFGFSTIAKVLDCDEEIEDGEM